MDRSPRLVAGGLDPEKHENMNPKYLLGEILWILLNSILLMLVIVAITIIALQLIGG